MVTTCNNRPSETMVLSIAFCPNESSKVNAPLLSKNQTDVFGISRKKLKKYLVI